MRLYPSLFAYLNNCQHVPESTLLHASDRPIIALDSQEDFSGQPFLIPLGDGVYEIAFPYLKPRDIGHHDHQLEYIFNLSISSQLYRLRVTDEVLDLDTIKEENELQEWENKLGKRLDSTAALLIRLGVGMFTSFFGYQKTRQPTILLTQLQEKLDKVKVDEANLPIVISLERRYQLRRKLEAIASKLRYQLRRQAELMPVGRIQEMDSYCLRDYIRRPGITAVEKAGAKQELMAIQRYQDYNTPENKFLVHFSQILYFNCYRYERSSATQHRVEVQKFRLVIDLFKQQPVVQKIKDRQYQFTKPNYVLQQNPIYRSFYLAYLEYLHKRDEKERIWSFRNQLLADTVYICLTAALLRFEGIGVDALSSIPGSKSPDKGRFIEVGSSIKARIFLQNQVYVFSLSKPFKKHGSGGKRGSSGVCSINNGWCAASGVAFKELLSDWLLTWEIHQLDSKELETKRFTLPLWVFWYRPNDQAIAQLYRYLQEQQYFQKGLVFYLQVPPNSSSPVGKIQSFSNGKLLLCQIPDPITAQGFSNTVAFMAHVIKSAVESPV